MSAPHPPDQGYWMARLAAKMVTALEEKDPKLTLKRALAEFLEQPGPVPSQELREMLRERMV